MRLPAAIRGTPHLQSQLDDCHHPTHADMSQFPSGRVGTRPRLSLLPGEFPKALLVYAGHAPQVQCVVYPTVRESGIADVDAFAALPSKNSPATPGYLYIQLPRNSCLMYPV
jgi:hypothetical protein